MSYPSAVTPRSLFHRAASMPGIAFLDGGGGFERAPLSHVAWAPLRRLRMEAGGALGIDGEPAPRGDPLEVVDRFLGTEASLGRTVIGAISFELGRWIEPRAGGSRRTDLPPIALSSYERVFTFDHRQERWLTLPPEFTPATPGEARVSRPSARLDPESYRSLFESVQRWIEAGDIYQANLSMAFDAEIRGDPAALYDRLAARNPVPYGAYLDFGDFQILSNSPELFLERRGERVATRPIKGTRPRGVSPEEDRRLAGELRADPKERAEHVMIVDLERSDLGRVAETGSVRVEEFAAVESYATLHHMESRVSARLRPDVRFSDVLRATFPGGSITGAPKIRAMQILDEIEPEPRGFYTGSILHFPPSGEFTLSIAIRTATVRAGRVRYAAGGAIVADSRADREYAECLLKARAFFAAASGSHRSGPGRRA